MSLRTLPVVFVSDSAATAAFYRALGFRVSGGAPGDGWVEMSNGGTTLGIHTTYDGDGTAPGDVQLGLEIVADETLEGVHERLAAAGYAAEPIRAQPFGRSMTLIDPDGARIQINEYAA